MLKLTLSTTEYLMVGENVRLVFLGGTHNHLRLMIDAPKDVHIVRSALIEKDTLDQEERDKLPQYYEEPERPEQYRNHQKRPVTAKTPSRKNPA